MIVLNHRCPRGAGVGPSQHLDKIKVLPAGTGRVNEAKPTRLVMETKRRLCQHILCNPHMEGRYPSPHTESQLLVGKGAGWGGRLVHLRQVDWRRDCMRSIFSPSCVLETR